MSNQKVRGLLAKAKAAQEEHEWREVLRIWEESDATFREISDDVLEIWGLEQWNKWHAWMAVNVPAKTVVERNHWHIIWELNNPPFPDQPKISRVNVAAAKAQIGILESMGKVVPKRLHLIANYKTREQA